MKGWEKVKVLSVNNREITLEELVRRLKTAGWETVLKPLLYETILTGYAREKMITVTAEELQNKFDAFRRRNGLFSAADTAKWLQEKGLTLEDVEGEIEVNIIAAKAREAIPREAVEKYFAENKVGIDAVEIGLLTVAEEEVAREILAQIREDEADFMVLAREYSNDERAKQGGYVGLVSRTGLPEAVSAAVFGAAEGEVVGPFELEAGYSLIRVIGQHPAILDDRRESEIRSVLFQNFLAEQESKAKISWKI
ncbi:peptidylprolyl isomerase [Candidatus Micrarchaeota archaeon]|nr:peptidylprolyl isomerase [Candidatus Micrarchaeota archaeon]